MKNTLLYFGSFNPVHNGHTAVARYALGEGIADELWFVVSPGNPLKDPGTLAPADDRLEMTRIATGEQLEGLNVSVNDIEISMPVPSYTIDTLRRLSELHPGRRFTILAGADIVGQLPRWKEYGQIVRNYPIVIYPRDGYWEPLKDEAQAPERVGPKDGEASGPLHATRNVREAINSGVLSGASVRVLDGAPRWDYSSTRIRTNIAAGKPVDSMLSPGVVTYIREHGLWRELPYADLEAAIAREPSEAYLYVLRGRKYRKDGMMDKAMNDFLRALELEPGNTEARESVAMLREIFAYRYTDLYNP